MLRITKSQKILFLRENSDPGMWLLSKSESSMQWTLQCNGDYTWLYTLHVPLLEPAGEVKSEPFI